MPYLRELIGNECFESIDLEFKSVLDNDEYRLEKWVKTIVAFANTQGGMLYVGVDDSGYAFGLEYEIIDDTKTLILKTIDRHIYPYISCAFDIRSIDNNGKNIY